MYARRVKRLPVTDTAGAEGPSGRGALAPCAPLARPQIMR